MACRLDRAAAEALWPALLQCANRLAAADSEQVGLDFTLGEQGWECAEHPDHRTVPILATVDTACAERLDLSGFPDSIAPWIRLYLPLLLGAWRARRSGSTFVTAHVAQTLDGRIACANGHSQWISNEANLLHAHRLRALHDAVLVGSGTVAADNPQLTTRLVAGADPRRVVLSGSANLADVPSPRHLFDAPGATVLSRHDRLDRFDQPHHQSLELVGIEPESDGGLAPQAVRSALATRGTHSIFLEGGSQTLSSFLAAEALDVLHIHVAPLILGSGIPSFSLAPVTHVRDGLQMKIEHFDLEGEILLACRSAAE